MAGGMPRLRAGDLRTKIEIMRQGPDGWAVIATPQAEVMGQDGREAVIGQALQGISTYRVRIRYRAGLLSSDQIRLNGAGGTDLNILSAADPNGEREQIMMIASTGSALPTS